MKVSLEEICTLVGLTLGIKQVDGKDRIQEELGAQSLDIAHIAAAVDRKYGVFLDEADLARISTVLDLKQRVERLSDG